MTVLLELLTALLEYLDLFYRIAVKALLSPQNASIFLIFIHTYYARNYAGIIATCLLKIQIHNISCNNININPVFHASNICDISAPGIHTHIDFIPL